jgi:hypothetical protein
MLALVGAGLLGRARPPSVPFKGHDRGEVAYLSVT